ncbi:MAG: sensor histidine kinase [Methylobacter sp.]|nr:MAG: sensor histidine kinase [Methylobacter sp.]
MVKNKSLKTEILIRLIIPLIAFVTFETVLSYFVTLHYVNATYDRWLLDSARSLMQEIKIKETGTNIELPPAALEILTWDDQDKTYFKILSATKGLLAGDPVVPDTNVLIADNQPCFYEAEINGKTVRVVAMVLNNPLTEDKIIISVAETVNKRQAMVADVLLADLGPQLILVMIAGFYLLGALKRGLKPLNSLALQIARRSPRDLSPIAEQEVFSEVKILTHTINDLLQRLAIAIDSQQRFVANAAHQLRTPLAGLKLQSERALRESDIGKMKPALEQIQSSADRASHTINQLLVLAKSAVADSMNEFKNVNLSELVEQVCIEWVPKALQKSIEISFENSSKPLYILGDAVLIRELLSNLLDNAVLYGHHNGHIFVRLYYNPNPGLIIEDDGKGIPEAEITKVTERFYRIAGSAGDGCGLGLAIVKEIADLHQAQLILSSPEKSTGTRIEVVFHKKY